MLMEFGIIVMSLVMALGTTVFFTLLCCLWFAGMKSALDKGNVDEVMDVFFNTSMLIINWAAVMTLIYIFTLGVLCQP